MDCTDCTYSDLIVETSIFGIPKHDPYKIPTADSSVHGKQVVYQRHRMYLDTNAVNALNAANASTMQLMQLECSECKQNAVHSVKKA